MALLPWFSLTLGCQLLKTHVGEWVRKENALDFDQVLLVKNTFVFQLVKQGSCLILTVWSFVFLVQLSLDFGLIFISMFGTWIPFRFCLKSLGSISS